MSEVTLGEFPVSEIVLEAGVLALADTEESSLRFAANQAFQAMLRRLLEEPQARHLLRQALSE